MKNKMWCGICGLPIPPGIVSREHHLALTIDLAHSLRKNMIVLAHAKFGEQLKSFPRVIRVYPDHHHQAALALVDRMGGMDAPEDVKRPLSALALLALGMYLLESVGKDANVIS